MTRPHSLFAQSAFYCARTGQLCTDNSGAICPVGGVGGCVCLQDQCLEWKVTTTGCLPGHPCALCDSEGSVCDTGNQSGYDGNTEGGYEGGYEGYYQGYYQAYYQGGYPPTADLVPDRFKLANSSGTFKTNFATGEAIYPSVRINNTGPGTGGGPNPYQTGDGYTYTTFFRNQSSTLTVCDKGSDPTNLYIRTANLAAGTARTFDAWPGGNNVSSFPGIKSWNYGSVGTRTARVFVDYDCRAQETSDTNNQATYRYTVGPEADLVVQALRLTDSAGNLKFNFPAGQAIYPYVSLKNQGGTTAISPDKKTYSAFFKNQPTGASVNQVGDITMTNGEFNANALYSYYCSGSGNKCSVFSAPTFTMPQGGPYTARVRVNYNNAALEGNYNNNQTMTFVYYVGSQILGKVYTDQDQSGTFTSGDTPYVGASVSLSGGPTSRSPILTISDGSYGFYGLANGTYTVTLTLPSHYKGIAPSGVTCGATTCTRTITVTPDKLDADFFITGKYTVSGLHFLDTDAGNTKNGAEVNLATSPNITATKPSGAPTLKILKNADGTYSISGMRDGAYTVSYVVPGGYYVNSPKPPTFALTLTGVCGTTTFSNATGATCLNGDISSLNFPLTQGTSWFQSIGGDVRFDDGFTNSIPASVAVSSPTYKSAGGQGYALVQGASGSHGIAFGGTSALNIGSGLVSASPAWQVLGTTGTLYTPVNAGSLRTSFDYVSTSAKQQGITPTNITSVSTDCSSRSSCSIPSTFPSGVYLAKGNLYLIGISVSAAKKIIFLVDGNLTISTPIDVPVGSSVVFIAKGDIIIDPAVGTVAPPGAYPPTPDIEGFFSADENFILQGNNDCAIAPDEMLFVEGSIVVNAGLGGSGAIQNNRNLCGNSTYPSFIIRERPDMLLNLPTLISVPTYIWQEVAP